MVKYSCICILLSLIVVHGQDNCKNIKTCSRQKEESLSYLDLASKMISKAKENYPTCKNLTRFVDCEELLRAGYNKSCVYTIWPRSRVNEEKPLEVYCDMVTDGGGWTVIQRRGDYKRPKDYFYKDWENYKNGFGDIERDFWLGNDNIFALTNQRLYSVRFDLQDVDGNKRYALYDTFWIDDESQSYTLHIADYSGDAENPLQLEAYTMADTQSQKKNKKKKKPSADKKLLSETSVSADNSKSVESNKCIINEILPQKVGMTTVFKDVEVTMTQCEVKSDVPNTTVSKKKKKKKSAKQNSGDPVNNIASTSENQNLDNLLNFSENRIELVNHPEISVTLSNLHEEKIEDITENDISILSQQTEQPNTNISSTGSKTKKKKRKKKHSENKEISEEPVPTAPTYEKLPANDDSCVLVVSHESFSNGSQLKLEEFADKVKLSQNGLADVLIQRKESVEEVQNHNDPFSNSSVQVGSSVSIFPVPNTNKEKSEVKADTAELSVKHVNNVKEGTDEVITNETIIPNTLDDADESKLTKAQLKAQRRAKQEAQRAAKLAKNTEIIQSSTHTPASDKCSGIAKELPLPKQSLPVVTELVASKVAPKSTIETFRKVRLFSHLPECKLFDTILKLNESISEIHPSVLEIGSQYSKGIICGSNARCVALLAAFKDVINDYKTPPSKNLSRDLESKFQIYLNFLNNCRPLSVSMINAVKFLKHQINKIESNVEEEEAKKGLCKFINNFVTEEILLAREAIGNSASAKIVNGDVILVYAYSSLIKEVLCKAHNQNKRFKVVVVDSRPKLEGLEMLRCLVGKGISCSYISISAVSYVMKEVSKVITGAHALLANGCVMARLGSKQVALVASAFSVPVLVCCETYKFCERVLTDSFVHNELGEPNHLIIKSLDQKNCLKNWQDLSSLHVLNLLYDVTPPDLISMVITEKGVLPCTSVPVVLRVRHAGLHE